MQIHAAVVLLLAPLLIAAPPPLAGPAGGLYYFAGEVDGDSSHLLRFDRRSGAVTDLGLLPHAPGLLPRGTLGADGTMAVLVMPPGGRHNSPAELVRVSFADGRLRQSLLDDRALYLQTPQVLADGTILWLRATPGPERTRADGRLMQSEWDFEVLALAAGAVEPRPVHQERALWFEILGAHGDRFVATSLRDDGTTVSERALDGRLIRSAPGERPPLAGPDGPLLPRIDGVERSVPVTVLDDGAVVWWTYGSADGQVWHLDAQPLSPADHRGTIELSILGEGP